MPIKNYQPTGLIPPTLGIGESIPEDVTVFSIIYKDPNNKYLVQFFPNPFNFSARAAADINDISIKIYGRFHSVYLKTGNTIIEQQYYVSELQNTFYFHLVLNHATSYEIYLD
jgi:hypothetical protein